MAEHDTQFRLITDLDQAEKLWKHFSPAETIFDTWEFRFIFHKYYGEEVRFYTAFSGNEPVGILPLQFNKGGEYLEFWGGSYMEDNRVMVKPGSEMLVPIFYGQVKQRAQLRSIRGNDPFTSSLPLHDYKYILPIVGMNGSEDYFQKYLDAESRGKMRRKVRKVEKGHIVVGRNNFDDLETLFTLNEENFGERSSFLTRPFQKEIFRELIKLPYEVYLLTFVVNGVKQAVSFSILYKDVYEYFNLGVGNDSVPGLSTYVSIKNLEAALLTGAKFFDAFTGDYGWKEHWHFEKIPQYKFEKE